MRTHQCLVFLLAATSALGLTQQPPHAVGIEAWTLTDTSRMYAPTASTALLRARPVRVLVWYPARAGDAARRATFATLAEADWVSSSRAVIGSNRPGDARATFDAASTQMADSPPASLVDAAWSRATMAGWDAEPAAGRAPGVVIVSGTTARGYFHVGLAEALAEAGYVVAHVTALGPAVDRPATIDAAGVEDAARDAALAVDRLRADPRVASGPLGAIGWSVGGVTALRLHVLRPGAIGAIVSLDSGLGYNYGPPLVSAADRESLAVTHPPLLHLVAGVTNRVPRDMSLLDALGAQRREIAGLRHAELTTIAVVAGADQGRRRRDGLLAAHGEVLAFLDRTLHPSRH